MTKLTICPQKFTLTGDMTVPGDKSISHRALMFSAIANGVSTIHNCAPSEDCMSTLRACSALGVKINVQPERITVHGRGLAGLAQPVEVLDVGNSGTSMRLLLGILAGQSFTATLTGDDSLSQRPMKRVTHPLRTMGACIEGRDDANFAPLTVRGSALRGIEYTSPVASAQVKSCLLLAGLFARGTTTVREPYLSRDHTERMLPLYGVCLTREGVSVSVEGGQTLQPVDFRVPGDISSAAFLISLALLTPGASLTLRSIGLNPTRIGYLTVIERMGAGLDMNGNENDMFGEPVGDVTVTSSTLKGVTLSHNDIVDAIDEIPILMVLATQAKGASHFQGLGELRVKETDRVFSMVSNLRAMGARIEENGDDITIYGKTPLSGAALKSFGDHRTAMSMIVAALHAEGKSEIDEVDCMAISFPQFIDTLKSLGVPSDVLMA